MGLVVLSQMTLVFLFCFCAILRGGEILNRDVYGISDGGSEHHRYTN